MHCNCIRKSFIDHSPIFSHDIQTSGKTCPLPKKLPRGTWHCEMLEIPVQGVSFLNQGAQTFPGSQQSLWSQMGNLMSFSWIDNQSHITDEEHDDQSLWNDDILCVNYYHLQLSNAVSSVNPATLLSERLLSPALTGNMKKGVIIFTLFQSQRRDHIAR